MLSAIESGYIQREIQEAAYAFQMALERGEEITVGVNRFIESDEAPISTQQIDPEIGLKQRESLARLRLSRDQKIVHELVGKVETAAAGDQNLMPVIIECVDNNVTLGEICGALRRVWGEYRPSQIV